MVRHDVAMEKVLFELYWHETVRHRSNCQQQLQSFVTVQIVIWFTSKRLSFRHRSNCQQQQLQSTRSAPGQGRTTALALVAQEFIPNPDNKPFVDHIDRNETNNTISNVRWCSLKRRQKQRPSSLSLPRLLSSLVLSLCHVLVAWVTCSSPFLSSSSFFGDNLGGFVQLL